MAKIGGGFGIKWSWKVIKGLDCFFLFFVVRIDFIILILDYISLYL